MNIIIGIAAPLLVLLIVYLINCFFFRPRIEPKIIFSGGYISSPDLKDLSRTTVSFKRIILELNNCSPFVAYNFNLETSLKYLSISELFDHQNKILDSGEIINLKFEFGSYINKSYKSRNIATAFESALKAREMKCEFILTYRNRFRKKFYTYYNWAQDSPEIKYKLCKPKFK